jgi:hypothetical protein
MSAELPQSITTALEAYRQAVHHKAIGLMSSETMAGRQRRQCRESEAQEALAQAIAAELAARSRGAESEATDGE